MNKDVASGKGQCPLLMYRLLSLVKMQKSKHDVDAFSNNFMKVVSCKDEENRAKENKKVR
jgi:hypothetical protein